MYALRHWKKSWVPIHQFHPTITQMIVSLPSPQGSILLFLCCCLCVVVYVLVNAQIRPVCPCRGIVLQIARPCRGRNPIHDPASSSYGPECVGRKPSPTHGSHTSGDVMMCVLHPHKTVEVRKDRAFKLLHNPHPHHHHHHHRLLMVILIKQYAEKALTLHALRSFGGGEGEAGVLQAVF